MLGELDVDAARATDRVVQTRVRARLEFVEVFGRLQLRSVAVDGGHVAVASLVVKLLHVARFDFEIDGHEVVAEGMLQEDGLRVVALTIHSLHLRSAVIGLLGVVDLMIGWLGKSFP